MSFGLTGCGANERVNLDKEKAAREEADLEEGIATGEETKKAEADAEKLAAEQANVEREEILNYLKEIKPLMIRADEITQVYETLRTDIENEEIDDYEFYDVIAEEVLPDYIKISEEIEQVMPSGELREIHETLIELMSKNTLAMSEILSAIDYDDYSKVTSANSILTEARKLSRDLAYKLQDISKLHNISPDEI